MAKEKEMTPFMRDKINPPPMEVVKRNHAKPTAADIEQFNRELAEYRRTGIPSFDPEDFDIDWSCVDDPKNRHNIKDI